VSSVRGLINDVLSSFGIAVPTSVAGVSAPPSSPSTLSGVLAPVQQVLRGVTTLLSQLFPKN
jgi:hypothetical protein